MKEILQTLLRILARAILKKYQPDIIGVTGSIGKTSAKEAIYTVLSQKKNVRRNIKNYNNEIGLPLTIIGASSGGRSVWGWFGVVMKALVLLLWKDKSYPEILVLEMAVDRMGDMKYLTDLAPCKIGVVTYIGPVHLEFFGSIDKIAKEKSVMVSHLDKNGWAILNCDNEKVCAMRDQTKARIIGYSIKNESEVMAKEIHISNDNGVINGINFKLAYNGSTVPVLLPNILGEHLVYAALTGVALGVIYEMNLVDISEALRTFKSPPGRMNLIDGIKHSYIIDDTYNAGPDSMIAGLDVFGSLPVIGKRFAILGDMLELGDYTAEGHRKVGEAVFKNNIDTLITVGERARTIAAEAERQGMDSDNVFTFSDAERAGRFLQDRIEQGDFIFVKGSQGMRMEKIVKEVMAEPMKAKELLVRQEKPWL